MPKTLLAVITCHGRGSFVEAIRNTWLPLIPKGTDVKFFLGRGEIRPPGNDEVFLQCGDGYFNLPEKVKKTIEYAYTSGYDYVFKVDDDVVIKPKEFFSYPYSKWHYIGGGAASDGSKEVQRTPWGFCYALSRLAMKIILSEPVPEVDGSTYDISKGDKFNDEAWVSMTLYQHGVYLHVDPHYHLRTGVTEDNPYKERPLPDGVSIFCVHIHRDHTRPPHESVNEMYRLAQEHLQV